MTLDGNDSGDGSDGLAAGAHSDVTATELTCVSVTFGISCIETTSSVDVAGVVNTLESGKAVEDGWFDAVTGGMPSMENCGS